MFAYVKGGLRRQAQSQEGVWSGQQDVVVTRLDVVGLDPGGRVC